MSDNKQSVQQRFLVAAVLSLLVLTVWSYFFAPEKPKDNANTAANVAVTNTPAPGNAQQPAQPAPAAVVNVPDNVPNRVITIKSPLYEVKLDAKGAVATSWILIKNVHDQHEKILFANDSTKADPKPLELISPEGLSRNPREIPFRLVTGDQNLDSFLNERNYQVSQAEDTIQLNGSESRQIDFVLRGENGLEVTKSFVFRADSYVTDLAIKAARNGQSIPDAKLLIGSSIGDQGIIHHNYYHIEPEAVGDVKGSVQRYYGTAFTYVNNQAVKPFEGAVDWAGVGDTYFAMAAIPAQPLQGLEYRASRYEIQTEPFYDGIIAWITRSPSTKLTKHLISAYVPVTTDGSVTRVYTGSKDYFTLAQYNQSLTAGAGRTIDIEELINFGYLEPITRPIAIPLLRALNFIYGFVGNYGTAIIIFTLIFYSLFFPIRWYQSKSFKKAQANAPKMKEIQDRLKDLQKKGVPMDDPRMREAQMEQLKMMKGAVPIGGCLPLLLQMPLFIALYVAVTISLDFRQASFLWLPDLSAGDPWHLLEFLFAASMAGSMVLTPTAPAVTPEQQMQQKMMMYVMPLMMLWVMWGAPAGLLLYWFFGNIVSFVQQFIINRMNKTNEPPKEEQVVEVVSKKAKPKFSTS
ncbi:MAG: membrane protein insertase YidC [Acidobacteriota bacterium]|nr:membrane protein insertase YidC [Acidobacteriota bacterium]